MGLFDFLKTRSGQRRDIAVKLGVEAGVLRQCPVCREVTDPQVGDAALEAPASGADQQRARSLAIASMVLGITGLTGFMLCGLAVFCGPIAVVLGHLARKVTRQHRHLGDGMAVAGLVTGYIGTGLLVAGGVFFIVIAILGATSSPDQ